MASLRLLLSDKRMRSGSFAKQCIFCSSWVNPREVGNGLFFCLWLDIHPDVIYFWNSEQKFLNIFFL